MNTIQAKQARLAAIEDEVNVLHPLLHLTLPKLPRVQHVEYTHGTSEMGADFVFSRVHDTFPDTEYIGVIAKAGKIAQDYCGVERQIKECEVERTFGNGRKRIYLTEIWVIATASISHNAQQKIHAEYKTKKVIFIDGDRLIGLIDSHLPNFWTDVSLQIGDYLHTVRTTNDRIDRSLSLISSTNERFYVDQDIFEAEQFSRKKRKPAKKVEIFEQIDRNDVLLVEGGLGSGKSKLIRMLIDHYSTPEQYLKGKLIPISLTFKEFFGKYEASPAKTVNGMVPVALRESTKEEAQYLLLIDGADEKDLGADKLADAVAATAKAVSGSKMKAVITSRWCDAYERNTALRTSTKRLELRPLSTNRLIEFIRRLCRDFDLKSRLIEDLKKSALFKELPKSPIAAILLAQLLNENTQDLPSNLTELYAKYTELSLGRWDVEKGLQTQKQFEALSTIITHLAEDFLKNQIEEMPVNSAKEFFAIYLKKRNLGLDANQLFEKLIARCDIVSVDPIREMFRFKHRTFIEFFYAKAHLKKPLIVDQRVWSPYWATTYYFVVGLQRDCPELLEEILNIKPTTEGERWMRLRNTANYLLAGFSSPYDIAEKAVADAMLEAADLYLDIAEQKIKSPFAVFSKMHFLWVVQMMVRKSYSYEFFKKAMDLATVRITEECDDYRRCAVALFFLSVISRELEEKGCFDYLLQNYQKHLPLEVELGIRHEAEENKYRSQCVKKLDQRVGRALRDNPSLQSFVHGLYEKPIGGASRSGSMRD